MKKVFKKDEKQDEEMNKFLKQRKKEEAYKKGWYEKNKERIKTKEKNLMILIRRQENTKSTKTNWRKKTDNCGRRSIKTIE